MLGVRDGAEGLFIALMLQAAAPPVISSPALAALMGLDAALSLATLIVAIAATPLTAPVFAAIFIGPSLEISPAALGLRLMAMLGGAALVAALIRRIAGQTWIDEQKERIDGLSVIALFVFAVALMDGVAASIISSPLLVLGLIALAFALSLVLTALTALVLARAGLSSAMAQGLAAAGAKS